MAERDDSETGEVTQLLRRWRAGDGEAGDHLVELLYDELRQLAGSYLRRERAGHTLAPTALVHEAYLRLAGGGSQPSIENRVHFFALTARAMRRVLVDHARHHAAARRPSPSDARPLDAAGNLEDRPDDPLEEVLAVHQALDRLREDHPRQAQVAELRYFGGLREPEIAEVLGVSVGTVSRDWRVARLLLARLLRPETASETDAKTDAEPAE
ncbi:MAG TPA: ECF-type sigma factor [Thermoanaerobaculia bacterium]|nr:ECF-type sigma factor [Thermoanaerobaculia bacterium]